MRIRSPNAWPATSRPMATRMPGVVKRPRRKEDATALEMCAAVATNYFPPWEAEKGEFRITHTVKDQKSVQEFTKLMDRLQHLGREDLDALQHVDRRMALIRKLANPE